MLNSADRVRAFKRQVLGLVRKYALVSILFFVIGLIVSPLVLDANFPQDWTFKREIGVADLIGVLNAIVVAFLFTYYLQQSITSDQAEKSRLVSKCDEAAGLVGKCHTSFLDCIEDIGSIATLSDKDRIDRLDDHIRTIKKNSTALSVSIDQLDRIWKDAKYEDVGFETIVAQYNRFAERILDDQLYSPPPISADLVALEATAFNELNYLFIQISLTILRR